MNLTKEEILARVKTQRNGCWLWLGPLFPNGYGVIRRPNKNCLAHRVSYELFKGRIPEKHVIDHICRNRACVNPEHLEAVTQRVNLARGVGISARNSQKTHCPKGHPYAGDNLIVYRGIRRWCKACIYARNRLRAREKRRLAKLAQ